MGSYVYIVNFEGGTTPYLFHGLNLAQTFTEDEAHAYPSLGTGAWFGAHHAGKYTLKDRNGKVLAVITRKREVSQS